MREIAKQLVAYEAAAAESSRESASTAADRVLDALRRSLSALMGAQGCRVLFARALTLARAKVPSLSSVTVHKDGSFAGLGELNVDESSEAGMVLTAQLLGLLAIFIGKELALRILMDVWPDLIVPDTRDSAEGEL